MGIFSFIYENFIHWILDFLRISIMHYGCPASSKTAKLQIRKKIFKV